MPRIPTRSRLGSNEDTAPAGVEVTAYVVAKASPFQPIQGMPASVFGPNWAFNFNLGQAGDYVLVIVGAPDTDKLELNVTVAAPATGNDGIGTPGNIGPVVENGEMSGDGSGIPAPHLQPAGHRPVNA